MKEITFSEAIKEFNSGGEVWVRTGDFGEYPMFEYDLDEDGEEIVEDTHILKHPKSLDMGDTIEDLEGYNKYYN